MEIMTYEEFKQQPILEDIERLFIKLKNLKENFLTFVKQKKADIEEIEEFMHSFNNQLSYDDRDKEDLKDCEKEIDRLLYLVNEKFVLETIKKHIILLQNDLKEVKISNSCLENNLQYIIDVIEKGL